MGEGTMKEMKIIKRSGQEVEFDRKKIEDAVRKANKEIMESARISDESIVSLAADVEKECMSMVRSAHVEEVQDMVEDRLMDMIRYG